MVNNNTLLIFIFVFLHTLLRQAVGSKTILVDCELDRSTATSFSTVAEAQQYIRGLQPLESDVVVRISGTCTPARADLPIIDFTSPSDGGTHNYSVTFTGPATLSGGVKLDAAAWVPAPHVGAGVYAYNLTSLVASLGPARYGQLRNGNLGNCAHDKLELFALGQPMVLARFPNVGSIAEYNGPWMDWLYVSHVGAREGEQMTPEHENSFVVANDTAAVFLETDLRPPNKVWLHGFWKYDWADNFIELINVTEELTASGTAKEYRLHYNPKTPPVYGIEPRARFYALNSLSLLDQLGEYFIDEATNILYFLGSPSMRSGAFLNAATAPLIRLSTSVQNVKIDALELVYGRGVGIQQTGGAVLTALEVANTVVTNFGRTAISLPKAANSTIVNVSAQHLGCTAMSFGGGDIKTLEPANLLVTGSHAKLYSRWTRTYNPGFRFAGVGLTFTHNIAENAPHQGMTGGGNNLLFAGNTFNKLCWEVRDSSAWYVGRSWVHRGIVVRDNLFTNIVHIEPTVLGSGPIQGVYLDDQQSGVTVVNNTFVNVEHGILLGGGRDNYIADNKCLSTSLCIAFDNRGMTWQRVMCAYNATYAGQLVEQLFDVHYQQPPYSVEYPQLPPLLSNRPCTPVNNSIVSNFACNTTKFINQADDTISSWGSVIGGNKVSPTCDDGKLVLV